MGPSAAEVGTSLWGPHPYQIVRPPDFEPVELGSETMPSRFFFVADEPAQPRVVLEMTVERGEPVIAAVSLRRRPGDPPLDVTQYRTVELGRLRRIAAELAALVYYGAEREAEAKRETFWKSLAKEQPTPRRGKRVSAADLQRAADVYRSALASGANPTSTVTVRLGLSYSTAARWIQEARRRGFLGPAPGRGVAGGAEPTSEQGDNDG